MGGMEGVGALGAMGDNAKLKKKWSNICIIEIK
jgi:hypothetical protein